jgi:exodeoxyribonuclease VII small subunit
MANLTFEKAMKKLEQIVHELEIGDQPLEKAIKKFEEGIQLSKFCSEKLDETEKRINVLLKDQNGNILEEPFTSGVEPEDE